MSLQNFNINYCKTTYFLKSLTKFFFVLNLSNIFTLVNQKNIYKFKTVLIMKKLLFTALAVVTFCGVAMANTVEVKEEVVIDFVADNCTDVYNETYKELQDLGLEHDAAIEAFAAYKDCKGLN